MSSLVFVVIVAVWAVYLVQHWVRRRDHLATARSVDRFSEAMRVLERRRELPAPEVDAAPRSYAASPLRPARPGRPEVVVKNGAHGATAVAPSAAYRRTRATARVRGAVLLIGSLAMMTLVTLSVVGVLGRWWAVAGVGVAAVALVLVRWSVATAAAGAPAGARPRPANRPVTRVHHPAARVERLAATGAADHQFAAQSLAVTLRSPARRDAVVAPAAASAPAPYDAAPYDVVEVEAGLRPSRPAEPAAPVVQPTDGTWSPVPVPPPTYTLKAPARRGELRGSVSLPADGTEMALEEEFEDLPRIDLVG
ncbi:hypothetical protein [Ornithinimicrobium avium]|uniref:Uncharacterized protein n=1 Tax=Ornithinimicrobium avium TaxID=2283195 RepID=A0A345NQF6_9MICO|nr:hypothetical protein [Ornithinimicrobium avium]AXH97264.1 hypothetical protein DV701_15100 [Ornithinimicrobium avium]